MRGTRHRPLIEEPAPRPRGIRTMAFVFGALVVGLSGLLLGIGARSPYTHGNLQSRFDPAYVRTEQVLVGEAAAYGGGPGAADVRVPGDPAATGARLFVTKGCAACHTLEARGGPVGPPIVGTDAETVEKKVRRGPGGMPRYSASLSDGEIEAIAAYLRSLMGTDAGK